MLGDHPLHSPLPVVFLSAFDDREYVERGAQEGGYSYLVKPLSAAQLAPVIEATVARSRELAELRESREGLRSALENQRAIGVAIGIMMERFNVGAHDAFESMRRRARSERRRLTHVAAEVVAASENLSKGLDSPPARPGEQKPRK